MELPLTANWIPVAYREGKTTDNPHGGKLTAFYVDFSTEAGERVDDVYWRRKTGNVPEVNKPVYGTISRGQYGPMFKIEQQQQGAPQQQMPQPQQSPPRIEDEPNYQSPPVPPAPQPDPQQERQRRIERQHSQEMALRLIEASRDAGDLDLTNKDMVGQYLNEVVRPLTDWFVKDLG